MPQASQNVSTFASAFALSDRPVLTWGLTAGAGEKLAAPARTGPGTQDMTRILVVEHDPLHRRILRVLLASPRIALVEVGTGEAAIDLLGMRQFDLVVLDASLPGMTGVETVGWIRTRMPLVSDIPVLGLIAEADQEWRGPMLARGMTAWTRKPISRIALVETVVQLMPGLHDVGL
ncbi:MAG: response regulator [Alphaproteobacteria bacterium]|nr:response regulator [Alphaproteobacteria bacterium]